jgi:hypothetical protein
MKCAPDSGRISVGYDVVGDITNDHGAGANNRTAPDRNVIFDTGSNPNPRAGTHVDATPEIGAWANMGSIRNDAFMSYSGRRVYDHVFSNPASRIYHCVGHDYRASRYADIGGNGGTWMYRGRQPKTLGSCQHRQSQACAAITEREYYVPYASSEQVLKLFLAPQDGAATKPRPPALGIDTVKEANNVVLALEADDVGHHQGVTRRAPYDEFLLHSL